MGSLVAPAPLVRSAQRPLDRLRSLAAPTLAWPSAASLLADRAHQPGWSVTANCSAGGSCRLLATDDAWLAVNMPRATDWELANAWLETDRSPNWDWTALGGALAGRRSLALLERARLLGLAVAPAAGLNADEHTPPHCEKQQLGPTSPPRPGARPLVVDLSALWAGPLCSHLLWLCGARVIKVESPTRPDGARDGNPEFYELLNQGKSCLSLDLPAGREALARLLAQADIVIEGSRPRALQQLGIDATSLLRANPGLTWVSITGYGRRAPFAEWIAFGDDAAAAGGLCALMHKAVGTYQFVGDALADPLTGIHAALAAWNAWQAGGGQLIDASLVGAARATREAASTREGPAALLAACQHWWRQAVADRSFAVRTTVNPRTPQAPARGLGADSVELIREFRLEC